MGVPYGIDYIDPWVHRWPGMEKPMSKAWFSYHLGRILEPVAVRHCSLITGVAPGYYRGVLERNPHLREQVHTASMPYGISLRDFDNIEKNVREARLFREHPDCFNFIYAGAMLPHAYDVLDALFGVFESLLSGGDGEIRNVRLHFVGTGKSPDDPLGHNVLPLAKKHNLDGYVFEHPNRIPYTDVLNHLVKSSGILIIGSDRPHYTPSKIFQSIAARKPIFALLHERSESAKMMQPYQAGEAFVFSDIKCMSPELLKGSFEGFIRRAKQNEKVTVDGDWFQSHTARASAGELARALNVVCG